MSILGFRRSTSQSIEEPYGLKTIALSLMALGSAKDVEILNADIILKYLKYHCQSLRTKIIIL